MPFGTSTDSVPAASPLTDSLYFVSAAVVVTDGQATPQEDRTQLSNPLLLTIDTTAPTPAAAEMLAVSDSGMFSNDRVTNKMQPAFVGTAAANDKVRVLANGQLVGQGVAHFDGSWEITVEPLVDGLHNITVIFEDLAGNVSAPSEPLQIVVDTLAPNTPYLDLISDTGRSDVDNITMENSPTVTMTTEDPNGALAAALFTDNLKFRIFDRFEGTTEVLVYDSSIDVAVDNQATAADGFTQLELVTTILGPLADGVHNLKLEVEDRAGNISEDFLLDVIVDAMAPNKSFGEPGVVNDGCRIVLDPVHGQIGLSNHSGVAIGM